MTAQPVIAAHVHPTMMLEHNHPNGTPHLCHIRQVDRIAWVLRMECGAKLPTEASMTEMVALIGEEDLLPYGTDEYCKAVH